jgi:L-fuculose-phosphate aldolase
MPAADWKSAIVEAGKRLHARGLITATEGNVSVREAEELFVTPAGVNKGALTRAHIVRTDLAGQPLEDGPRISSEMPMHVAIYSRRPDVRAIVHAHPPVASAFSVAHQSLDRPLLAEAVVVLGPVPLVPYATPSTWRLADLVARAAVEADALLLANHGAVALGATLDSAIERMETLEHLARVSLIARVLGGERPLSPEDVRTLAALRAGGLYGM